MRRLQSQPLRYLGAEADVEGVSLTHIRCKMLASLRATATIAHNMLDRLAIADPTRAMPTIS
jgi:hypothetical protein